MRRLTDDEIETRRSFGRRSLLGLLGATIGGATALATGCGARQGPRPTGGGERPDAGATVSEPDAHGRAAAAGSSTADSDATDPVGSGRNPVSDSDSGPNSDAAGHGRTGITDSDSGPGADLAGRGRGTNGGAIQMED